METSDFRRMTPDARSEYLFSICQMAEVDLPIAKREIKHLRNRITDLERIKRKANRKERQSAKSKAV